MLELLNATISVSRPTYSQGSNMGISGPLGTVYSNIPACIQPASVSVQTFYNQRQLSVTHRIYTNHILTLARGDIVTSGGTSYQVQGWRNEAGLGWVMSIDVVSYAA